MGIGNRDSSSYQSIDMTRDNNHVLVGDLALSHANGTAVQKVIESIGKTATQVFESGGDIITAPAICLKSIKQNWLTYMIVTASFLSFLTFIYCTDLEEIFFKGDNAIILTRRYDEFYTK